MPKSYVKLKRRIQDVLVDLTSQEKPNTVFTREMSRSVGKGRSLQ